MANIPVKEKTHTDLKVLKINLNYNVMEDISKYNIKSEISQDDIISLLIENVPIEKIVEFWRVKNIKGYIPNKEIVED